MDSFFDSNEQKQRFINAKAIDCIYNDNTSADEWKRISDTYKALLPYGHLDQFRLEVGESGSFFIRDIFSRYIDDDTFVVTSRHEHETVKDCLKAVKHKLELVYEDIILLDINSIYDAYVKSGCKKFALYMVGTLIATGEIIPQEFFERLKKKIPDGLYIIDDVHGMFITPRDYSMFDAVIYTCHSWVSSFNMGLIWSRLPDKIGYRSKENTVLYLDLIKVIIEKFDKVRLFKTVLIEFFAAELADSKTYGLFNRTTQHIFALVTYGLVFTQEFYDEMFKECIRFGETLSYRNFVRIRFQEFILKDPDEAIKALNRLKQILKFLKQVRDQSGIETVFTGEKNVTRKHLNDPHGHLDLA